MRASILLAFAVRGGFLVIEALVMLLETAIAFKINDRITNNDILRISLIGGSIVICGIIVLLIVYIYMRLPFEVRFSSDSYVQQMLMWYGKLFC